MPDSIIMMSCMCKLDQEHMSKLFLALFTLNGGVSFGDFSQWAITTLAWGTFELYYQAIIT